jgi:hypothetical protein
MLMNQGNTASLGGNEEITLQGLIDYLCMVMCDCLKMRKGMKKEAKLRNRAKKMAAVVRDIGLIDTPSAEPEKASHDFQKCVEGELEGNPLLKAEQPFDMTTSPPSPIPDRVPGHARPDVVVLNGPGAASGSNIGAVVEMKFPPDTYGEGQAEKYERIASENNPDAQVITLSPESCQC